MPPPHPQASWQEWHDVTSTTTTTRFWLCPLSHPQALPVYDVLSQWQHALGHATATVRQWWCQCALGCDITTARWLGQQQQCQCAPSHAIHLAMMARWASLMPPKWQQRQWCLVITTTVSTTMMMPCYHHHHHHGLLHQWQWRCHVTTTTTPTASMITMIAWWHHPCHQNNNNNDTILPPPPPHQQQWHITTTTTMSTMTMTAYHHHHHHISISTTTITITLCHHHHHVSDDDGMAAPPMLPGWCWLRRLRGWRRLRGIWRMWRMMRPELSCRWARNVLLSNPDSFYSCGVLWCAMVCYRMLW